MHYLALHLMNYMFDMNFHTNAVELYNRYGRQPFHTMIEIPSKIATNLNLNLCMQLTGPVPTTLIYCIKL